MNLNKAELAEALDVSLPTIDAWIRKGYPVVQRGSRGVPWSLNLADVVGWLTEQRDNGNVDVDLAGERALVASSHRAKTDIEVKRLNSELVETDRMVLLVSGMVNAAKSRLLTLPSKMQSRNPSLDPGVVKQVRSLIYKALEELATQGLPPELRARMNAHPDRKPA